jgi:hypothetical protein
MSDIEYLVYQPNTIKYQELLTFFQETDDLLVPRLSSRVNLVEYAEKVAKNAVLFVAKKGEEWIGVEALYFKPYPDFSFSTYLCIKKAFQNTSTVGVDLMLKQRQFLKEHRTKGLRFAIRKSNAALLNYHLKTGGRIIAEHIYPNTDIVEVEMEKVFIKE